MLKQLSEIFAASVGKILSRVWIWVLSLQEILRIMLNLKTWSEHSSIGLRLLGSKDWDLGVFRLCSGLFFLCSASHVFGIGF